MIYKMDNDAINPKSELRIDEAEVEQLTAFLQENLASALPQKANVIDLIDQISQKSQAGSQDKIDEISKRWQDPIIEDIIPERAFVLDLGCGDGDLLLRLMQKKKVRGQGVEKGASEVIECVQRGVPVFHTDIDQGLPGFQYAEFDYVILEETLQTLHHPIRVLEEMLRVGRRSIISFPNFGYWRVRLELALGGRMPQTEWLPHHWYDTPNIHLCCLQDFLDWTQDSNVTVSAGFVLCEGEVRELRDGDNLHAEEALLVVERI